MTSGAIHAKEKEKQKVSRNEHNEQKETPCGQKRLTRSTFPWRVEIGIVRNGHVFVKLHRRIHFGFPVVLVVVQYNGGRSNIATRQS